MPIDTNAQSFSTADMNSNITALMVYERVNGVWQVKGKVTSGGGNHAEEELAADLNGANLLNISQGARIYIEITKSPCYYHEAGKCCTMVLINLKQTGRVSSIRVDYLGLYKINDNASTWGAVDGIGELEADGIKCNLWKYTHSFNASQRVFMNQYQNDFDSGRLGGGFWTNPKVRRRVSRKRPSAAAWKVYFQPQ